MITYQLKRGEEKQHYIRSNTPTQTGMAHNITMADNKSTKTTYGQTT
jgi:hypothetical protein